jgi:hypothetical protein
MSSLTPDQQAAIILEKAGILVSHHFVQMHGEIATVIREREQYYGQRKLAEQKLNAIEELIDGYLDGAPDASEASKLANRINGIIHPL